MAICYLGTFIHVQEEEEEDTPPLAPRSFSAPSAPARWQHEMSMDECQCREYIEKLPERLLDWAAGPSDPSAGAVAEPSQPVDICPSVSEEDCTSSLGSKGHPEFCSRPCVYVSKGACVNGPACAFCHLPHTSTTKLDKRQRTMLNTMRNPEVLALLHSVLSAKVKRAKKKGIDLPLQEILRLLEEEMMTEDDSLSSTSKRELQSLQGVLSKMSVASVLGLANISRFRLDLCDGIRDALARLR
ncbi:unnamed protein product [Effrenium voratum]|nr:unnamed protein product [Effrenium voratum]|mmetsp:Transcript_136466/g.323188  ORF Transcript_136466/g.323188 Transcript_136466/m.323188 type:complete len:243 (+) Transcript_136466:69-797(+)|eukprot:CAMPEP_0181435838 /NCGR_PEP_ID=MMETSP1110-20121109/20539_1 /TAXON_ID=174948 /ORGANISM="Symbiodinium sp., Strain CCMP421" /LENGTH=242 /DNA_ID=CAMNT_0023559385 /DNA_START=56 /DNA_END=784 /DNA_ORIENTATION=+